MSADDWGRLEGVDSTERILRAALGAGAAEIQLSSDEDGASIFFCAPERIEFFRHIPINCADAIRLFLRQRASIDTWKRPPATGMGVFHHNGETLTIEVQLHASSGGEDILVRLHRGSNPDHPGQ